MSEQVSNPLPSTEKSPLTIPADIEAIILAGGLGTRLRSVVPELPKCLAPVAGRPFLFYLVNYLRLQGVTKFIFALGYKHDLIGTYLRKEFASLQYQVVIETEPMGTGGAAKMACLVATEKNVLLANGDTLFMINVAELISFHLAHQAGCTLCLKPLKNIDRYGVVDLGEDGLVESFMEKRFYQSGLINGGIYALNAAQYLSNNFPEKFSFEKDFLEKLTVTKDKHSPVIRGIVQDNYFIDIGIPADLEKAGLDFSMPRLNLDTIGKDWTLFLDRDGVINKEKADSYVYTPEEFVFYEGALESFEKLAARFGRIIIVTNQRGIGKGLMSGADLEKIHAKLLSAAASRGVNIAAIYHCPGNQNSDPGRKPNPGMAAKAKKEFPEIEFRKSVMVGNNTSDMDFGKNAGMYTVFIRTTHPQQQFPSPDIDLIFDSLGAFADAL